MLATIDFVHAFIETNAERIAGHYTQDGRLLPSHGKVITSRLAIRAFWQGVLDMDLVCLERTATEIQSEATIGHETGTYALCRRNGQLVDQGTYIALWQWKEDRWQIYYDLWHSSRLALMGNRKRIDDG